MGKRLSEMTLEELWQLFPIILTEHRDCWEQWYDEERDYLSSFLPTECHIYHIGSTAIKGIWAKPIVDILVEIPCAEDIRKIGDVLVGHGYICMSENDTRISLNKGYTDEGFAQKVFHIHVRFEGDRDEVIFRDYLNGNPEVAKEYEKLKLGLWKEYEHDRDGYTEAKTEFVKKVMEDARVNENSYIDGGGVC